MHRGTDPGEVVCAYKPRQLRPVRSESSAALVLPVAFESARFRRVLTLDSNREPEPEPSKSKLRFFQFSDVLVWVHDQESSARPRVGLERSRRGAQLVYSGWQKIRALHTIQAWFEFGRTFPRNCVAILLTQGPYGSGKSAIHITVMACSTHKLSRIHTQPVLMP